MFTNLDCLTELSFGFRQLLLYPQEDTQVDLRPQGILVFEAKHTPPPFQRLATLRFRFSHLTLSPALPGQIVQAAEPLRIVRTEPLEAELIRLFEVRVVFQPDGKKAG